MEVTSRSCSNCVFGIINPDGIMDDLHNEAVQNRIRASGIVCPRCGGAMLNHFFKEEFDILVQGSDIVADLKRQNDALQKANKLMVERVEHLKHI